MSHAVDLLDRLGIDVPVLQAGMGGGIAGAKLAGAVSRAGGLGTVGILPPEHFAAELRRAREAADGRPVSANLLLPFTRRAHVEACVEAGVGSVSLFFGFDRRVVAALRSAGIVVLHQVGTVEGVRRALGDGAVAVVAQGREAGGHLLAEEPVADFLPRALEAAGGAPVLAAGGIADAADVRRVLDAGAAAAWCGTRFLLTDESRAHPAYKARALGAAETVETKVFGFGWPDRHRVLPNAATARWGSGPLGAAATALNAATRPLARVVPASMATRMLPLQRAGLPLLGPQPPLGGMDERLLEVAPLYAGECAARITSIVPAEDAVRALAPRA